MLHKENERISFEKIENGFIVTHSFEEGTGDKFKFISKRFFTKTASETRDKMIELQKAMEIN